MSSNEVFILNHLGDNGKSLLKVSDFTISNDIPESINMIKCITGQFVWKDNNIFFYSIFGDKYHLFEIANGQDCKENVWMQIEGELVYVPVPESNLEGNPFYNKNFKVVIKRQE